MAAPEAPVTGSITTAATLPAPRRSSASSSSRAAQAASSAGARRRRMSAFGTGATGCLSRTGS